MSSIVERLREFMECEGKSCSYDPELITLLMVELLSLSGHEVKHKRLILDYGKTEKAV